MKKNKGFTLVELLAVIVILAIVALVVIPVVMGVIKDARKKAAIESFRGYMDAAEKAIIPIAKCDRVLEEAIRGILILYKWS